MGDRGRPKKTLDFGNDGEKFTCRALLALPGLIDNERCAGWLFEQLAPGQTGTTCPHCGVELGAKVQATFRRLERALCCHCGQRFKATQGTPFHGGKLSLAEIILTAALVEMGAEAHTIAHILKRGPVAAREWRERLLAFNATHRSPNYE